MDGHIPCMARERPEVLEVTSENGTTGFGHRDHDGVDGRPLAGEGPQGSRPTGDVLGQLLDHVAGLQQAVDDGVSTLSPGEGLYEYDGWHDGWPEPVPLEHCDQRGGFRAALCEAAYAT